MRVNKATPENFTKVQNSYFQAFILANVVYLNFTSSGSKQISLPNWFLNNHSVRNAYAIWEFPNHHQKWRKYIGK